VPQSRFAGAVIRLYLNVYERATLRFEKLMKDFFLEVARRMPDKARFFVWPQKGRIIGFSMCLSNKRRCSEYVGMDYAVTLNVHLYFVIMRDLIEWAIAHRYEEFLSTGLVYAPNTSFVSSSCLLISTCGTLCR
jgi:predicted N-acyltransferase